METCWLGGPAVASVYDTEGTAGGNDWVVPKGSSPGVGPETDVWSSGLEVPSGSMVFPVLVSGLSQREVACRMFKEVPGRPSLTPKWFAVASGPAWFSRW